MGGPLPISSLHLESWQRLNQTRLTPWELEMVAVFDDLVLEAAQKRAKEKS